MYLGHRVLGALEMLGSILLWTMVISSSLVGGAEAFITTGIVLFIFNGLDGLLTYRMAQKGYMLADLHSGALNAIPA